MIELRRDALVFSFPEVHAEARFAVGFERTLRIPDDEKSHFLPPSLGRFPLRHVDDHAENLLPGWIEHGGVMLPMYQSEALWIEYYADDARPVEGSKTLRGLKSVREVAEKKGDAPLPENESVTNEVVVRLRGKLGRDQVREGW